MIRRRSAQVFSLAFLDCICCGFGAIILIFVLSIGAQDQDKLKTLESLRRILAAQVAQLVQLQDNRTSLAKENSQIESQLVEVKFTNDSVQALIDEMEQKIQDEKKGQEALVVDVDELQKEIAARQKKQEMVMDDVAPTPVGVPIGSNYIAFVIDTSGSMRDFSTYHLWPIVIQKIQDVLDAYPEVRGIQVLNSDGRYLVRGSDDTWLPDSPSMRQELKRIVSRYDEDSHSNPVPGILRVLRRLYDAKNPEMHLGIYVFGDEFDGGTAAPVLKTVDELNPPDADGHRRVVINAIGFPTAAVTQQGDWLGSTGLKFANLMRELTYENGGAFIALQDL